MKPSKRYNKMERGGGDGDISFLYYLINIENVFKAGCWWCVCCSYTSTIIVMFLVRTKQTEAVSHFLQCSVIDVACWV